jgi:hypothetical protein
MVAGEEAWIPELRRFITQPGEVVANLVAEPVGTKGEPEVGLLWANVWRW